MSFSVIEQDLRAKVGEISQTIVLISEKLDRIILFLSALPRKTTKPLEESAILSTEEESDDDRDSMLSNIDGNGECSLMTPQSRTKRRTAVS